MVEAAAVPVSSLSSCQVRETGLKSLSSPECVFLKTDTRHDVFNGEGTCAQVQTRVENMLKWLPLLNSTGLEHSWAHSIRTSCFLEAQSPQFFSDLICGDGGKWGGPNYYG